MADNALCKELAKIALIFGESNIWMTLGSNRVGRHKGYLSREVYHNGYVGCFFVVLLFLKVCMAICTSIMSVHLQICR